jgi:YD repeat-containing protein
MVGIANSAETDRINATTTFAYDAANNLLTITDAQNAVTTYVYDSRGLLTSETYPAGQQTPDAARPDKRSYTYDSGRRLKTRTDQAAIITTYTYDRANRLTVRSYTGPGAGLADGFTYDNAGRLLTATSGRYGVSVSRSYDPAGRVL